MNLKNLNEWIVPFSITIGVIGTISVAMGTFIAMFFNTKRKTEVEYSERLIQTLKENAEAEKKKADRLAEENRIQREDFQKQINDLKLDVANLASKYEAAEKSKQEYLEILKDKNPEQVEFMKLMTAAAKQSTATIADSKKYMETTQKEMAEIAAILMEVRTALHTTNKKTQAIEERNKKRDKELKASNTL